MTEVTPDNVSESQTIALARLTNETEQKRIDAKSKLLQVIFGTMIVGVAAAAFPFMQKLADVSAQKRIEEIRKEAQIDVLERENELKRELALLEHDLQKQIHELTASQARRDFLNSLASEARSDKIEKRIILAEFFSFLGEDQVKWAAFREFLYQRQKKLNEELRGLAGQEAANASRIQQIQRLENPEFDADASASCTVDDTGVPDALGLVDGLVPEIQHCLASTAKPLAGPVEFIVLHNTAGRNLQADTRLIQNGRTGLRGPLAHFVIGRSGTIVQTARTTDMAMHAGRASFNGRPVTNSRSIGIEFVNDNRGEMHSDAQIVAAIKLLSTLVSSLGVPPENVVGHDQIAPGRKTDPGPHFPWDRVRDALSRGDLQ